MESPATFHPFQNLPTEIRLLIWQYALPRRGTKVGFLADENADCPQRAIHVYINYPTVMHVCSESRAFVFSSSSGYLWRARRVTYGASRGRDFYLARLPFDADRDFLWLGNLDKTRHLTSPWLQTVQRLVLSPFLLDAIRRVSDPLTARPPARVSNTADTNLLTTAPSIGEILSSCPNLKTFGMVWPCRPGGVDSYDYHQRESDGSFQLARHEPRWWVARMFHGPDPLCHLPFQKASVREYRRRMYPELFHPATVLTASCARLERGPKEQILWEYAIVHCENGIVQVNLPMFD